MQVLQKATLDQFILFLTCMLRNFTYGAILIFFMDFMQTKFQSFEAMAWLQSILILADATIAFVLPTNQNLTASKILQISSLLKIVTLLVFSYFNHPFIIFLFALFGLVSPTGQQIGPFRDLQERGLIQLVKNATQSKSLIQSETKKTINFYDILSVIFKGFGAIFAGYFITSNTNEGQERVNQSNQNCATLLIICAGILTFNLALYLLNTKQIESGLRKPKQFSHNIRKLANQSIPYLNILFFLEGFGSGITCFSILSFSIKKLVLDYYNIGQLFFIGLILSQIARIVFNNFAKVYWNFQKSILMTSLPVNISLIFIGYVLYAKIGSKIFITYLLVILMLMINSIKIQIKNSNAKQILRFAYQGEKRQVMSLIKKIGSAIALLFAGFLFQNRLFFMPILVGGTIKLIVDVCYMIFNVWTQNYEQQVNFKKVVNQGQLQSLAQMGNQDYN